MSQHAKDRKGHSLKVGHRVLIPAKIVNISPTPGQYDTKVLLEETAGLRDRTEVILNSSQVELHPDEVKPASKEAEPPVEEPKTPPATGSDVKDSNV